MPIISGPLSGADEIGRVLLALIVALVAAKLGGEIAARLGQPAVLGELIFGVLVGNAVLLGWHGLDYIKNDLPIEVLSEIGIVALLFQVGLESNLDKMKRVGVSALACAAFGVCASFVLGMIVVKIFVPGAGPYAQVFMACLICSSSIGIAARVFMDMGQFQSAEARTILGAAVIDDVMGLVLVAVVAALIGSSGSKAAPPSAWSIVLMVLKAAVFLVGSVVIGRAVAPMLFRSFSRFKMRDMLLTTALGFCFGFGYIAWLIGLAPIIGAFTAGLALEEVHWRGFTERGEHSVQELMKPIVGFLAPIFFFRMGARVDLMTFSQVRVMGFAACLVLAAIVGKQACALGAQKAVDRLTVGLGMIPRGEVILIAAAIGSKLLLDGKPVVDPTAYSAAVIVVIVTTLVTPPLLKWRLSGVTPSRHIQTKE